MILDVRGRAAYEFGGHIPGAVHSTWHEYSDPHAVPKGLLDPDRGRMEQKIRALGISQDSDVVIYSNPFDNWGDEGRMFWMLEYLGHTRLRILDGGWVKWVQEKRPFEHGCVTPKSGDLHRQAGGRRDRRQRRTEASREAAASGHRDRRCAQSRRISWERGVGDTATRPHSSAIHLAWTGFLQANATVKDLQTITKSLAEKGLTQDQEVICYCTGGVPFSLAVFCPQTRRVSEGPQLSGILVGVESGFCLSGGKGRQGIAANPERRSPGAAFLTVKNGCVR